MTDRVITFDEDTAVQLAQLIWHDDDKITVYGDENDAFPYKVIWEHRPVGSDEKHDVIEEEYLYLHEAFARVAVVSYAIENDAYMTHNPVDPGGRNLFRAQVSRFLDQVVDHRYGLDYTYRP